MLTELLGSVGVKVRNLIVDYHDKNMEPLHRAMQIPDRGVTDDVIIAAAARHYFKQKGYDVYSIIEVLGDYTLADLRAIADDDNYVMLKGQSKLIYIDPDKAFI